ncbi:uncharacterized protein LOC129567372 [Sitodiplosis mosellana]|uniref:uncharacterized protein LOC129567372 n=1 Tax=Sitodiplosis mosellana TaxID=263140 RepID=UPI0024444397|nr:uncharacterized protein LOC129567372 [Sitodiplosis mosellana]
MEQEIDKVLDDTIANENITACLSANRHGLCIGARGNISQQSSGLLVALLDQAQKLEPQSGPPVVILETAKNSCLIHKHGVTGVIVKNLDRTN